MPNFQRYHDERIASTRLGIAPHGIDISSATLQVMVKCLRDIQDTFNVLHCQLRLLINCQSLRCANVVLNLERS